jgi:hypothetical protein
MRMLNRDDELFHHQFHDAASFLRDARLRYECYKFACSSMGTYLPYSPWQKKRFQELLSASACHEPWFVKQLRGDAPHLEKFLIDAGL